ncbi:MAG: RNA polymerase sigma factor [Paracoccaceae bacterium]
MTEPAAAEEAVKLMAGIAAGREVALAQLMAMLGRDVAVFAGRYLGNRADGEEIAQEVFLRVWRMAGRYDPARGRVTTWIYRIAVNLCIDRQRRNRFWRLFGREQAADWADVLPDETPDATAVVAGRQALAQVQAGIAALPERQRMAIMLTAVGGLNTAEVAQAMASSVGAVEQLLVRARRALRNDLGDDDAD